MPVATRTCHLLLATCITLNGCGTGSTRRSCLASPLPHIPSPASRQAFATFMSALALDAAHLPSVMSIGSLYKARAMLPDALAAYSRAHELAPGVKLCAWMGGGGLRASELPRPHRSPLCHPHPSSSPHSPPWPWLPISFRRRGRSRCPGHGACRPLISPSFA